MPVGRLHGRHGVAIVGSIALAVASAALAAAPAWRIARAWFAQAGPGGAVTTDAGLWMRTGVLTFAIVVAIGLVLGSLGRLTIAWYLIAEVAFLGFMAIAARTREPRGEPGGAVGHRWAAVGVWVAIVAFVVGMAVSNSPYTAYDAVSYHLFFPARWLQAHRLLILPTPFSDEAQAYQPGNGELWFLWLMLPLHGDLVARAGQIPFYLIGAAASYLLALRCGASRAHALYAPTVFLVAPPIVEQAVGANVDLIAAAMFVCAIELSLAAIESNRRRDWAMWGIATGLFLGTKYLAVVYAPLLVACAVCRGVRPRALWGVAGIAALGLPWYIRNWIVAGSPLYPATLTLAGVTVGRGAYTHAAMRQSFMHTTEDRLLAVSLVHAFGAPFFIAFAPVVAYAVIVMAARRRWWPWIVVLTGVVGVVALCWTAVGDDTDSRFLLPAVALLPAMVPMAFGASRRVHAALHGVLIAGLGGVLVGLHRQIRLPLPWYMADWLPLHGVIFPGFVVPFFVLAIAAMGICAAAARRRLLEVTAIALTAVAGAGLAAGASRWCPGGLCEYVQIDDPHIRTTYRYAARWFTEHVRGASVAYTGINLPYSLSGSDLSNTVQYVNIDNHHAWRFDQYAAAYERGEVPSTSAEPLATPSGVLVPASGPDAVRPRFERRTGDRDEWKMNLKRADIAYVFVASLDGYEIDYNWHTPEGFPIEDEWARSEPQTFRLVYANEQVRIYQIVRL